MSIINLATNKDFEEFVRSPDLLVIHFYTPWALQCTQMNDVLEDLTKSYKNGIKFGKIEAEDLSEISLKYEVTAVPTIILVKNTLTVAKIEGANPLALAEKISEYVPKTHPVYVTKLETSIEERLQELVNQAPCMLFMKGNPKSPKCGFSRTIVGILDTLNADYESFDILQDNTVRESLKKFSNWPTYPQLYLNGELIGGVDIVKELNENGELVTIVPKKS